MKCFYSGGGNNRPHFIYRFKVKNCTSDMYDWADTYPEKGPFSRFHVEWASVYSNIDSPRDYDVIQFELHDAYLAFMYAFAGEIIEDQTWKEYR